MSEKKEKFIIFALAGALLLIVCIPVKKKETAAVGETALTQTEDAAAYSGSEKETAIAEAVEKETEDEKNDDYVEETERKLEEWLSCLEGAGKVKVMLTLKAGSEAVVEKDRPVNRSNVTENDSAGGNRSSNDMDSQETTVFITDGQGIQRPYVRKTMEPVVEGVAVLAEGGGSEGVRQNISEAIQVLFGIDANKIKIAKMKTIR